MVVSKQLYFLTLLFTNNGFETLSTRGTLKGRSKLQGTSLVSCFWIAYVDCTVSTATAIFLKEPLF